MGDNLMEKVSALGEKLKISGAEVGRKMTEGMTSMSFKMREFIHGQNPVDKIVEEVTMETMKVPDWSTNLEICDMANSGKMSSQEVIKSIKKRIMLRNHRVQYLALVLLEICVENCEKAFSEVASERVLDEMVKMIDDPQTIVNNRNKALFLIERWGESSDELRYLPVYEETYKSLKSRGIRFPGTDNESLAPIFTPPRSVSEQERSSYPLGQHLSGYPQSHFHNAHSVEGLSPELTKEAFVISRNSIELLSSVLSASSQPDALKGDLTTMLVNQCRRSQITVQRIVETAGEDDVLLFEALNLNDEIQQVLFQYEEMEKRTAPPSEPQSALPPVPVEPEGSPRVGNGETLVGEPTSSRAYNTTTKEDDDLMHDLDEMIFGKKAPTPENHEQNKKQDDLITF